MDDWWFRRAVMGLSRFSPGDFSSFSLCIFGGNNLDLHYTRGGIMFIFVHVE